MGVEMEQTPELKPCPLCGEMVEYRHNLITGEWLIGHMWNSKCQMRPFYGSAYCWNNRPEVEMLQANLNKWIKANNAAIALINEQAADIAKLQQRVTRARGLLFRSRTVGNEHRLPELALAAENILIGDAE